jgi:hypothetical protein
MAYERLKCPQCDSDFGQEVRFLDHITDVHGISNHLDYYVSLNHDGIHPTCNCSNECNVKLPWAGWKKGFLSKYARGHNARIDSIYFDKDRQSEFAEKRKASFQSGKYKVWNDGLTKETDEKVRVASVKISQSLNDGYRSGAITDWHAKDPQKAAAAAKKSSETKRMKFMSGEFVPWNKGLTKYTNESVYKSACAIKENYAFNPCASSRRFSQEEFLAKIKQATSTLEILGNEPYKNKYQRFNFRCTCCDTIQEKNLMMIMNTPTCFTCHPKTKASKCQLEIFEFVKSLCSDAVLSDRTAIYPLELDVWIPNKRVGIEYDGLYYHSDVFYPSSDRVLKKMQTCDSNGINMFRIFEDEWRDKRPIVEKMIKHRLGFNVAKFGARACKIVELAGAQRRKFMNENHLDGDVIATKSWGLSLNDEIVAALSLRRPFHKKYDGSWEVARFCSSRNIPGALSKLLSYASEWVVSNKAKNLVTYVDRRLGSASGYMKAGFVIDHVTKPRFWWTDYVNRYDRFKYRADVKNNRTQADVADDAGVVKIWGSPNLFLVRTMPNN